jgi:cellulose synthase/poly-beta-1,6-N-acetylglucosamine synthase-like glycosyltransferase
MGLTISSKQASKQEQQCATNGGNHCTTKTTKRLRMWLLRVLFWTSLTSLALTWLGYPLVLWIYTLFPRRVLGRQLATPLQRSSMTVIIAAHNEQGNIRARLENVLAAAPDGSDIEVIVMSDNSTDQTLDLARAFAERDKRVSVFETAGARGKSAAHNQGVARAHGKILVFTDAETQFLHGFLDSVARAFDDPDVGFVSGQLQWNNPTGGVTGQNFSLYWRFEVWLRTLETMVGIHALGTGACSAMRKEIFRPIPANADQDFISPLDCVMQGYRCVFVPEAKAIDYVAATVREEFKNRVRMTAKNFWNTFAHWGLNSCYRFPMITAGLIFHKLLRWLTPYFVSFLLGTGSVLALSEDHTIAEIGFTLVTWIALATAMLGAIRSDLPVLGSLWSFTLANAAFAVGIVKAVTNRAPTHFRRGT